MSCWIWLGLDLRGLRTEGLGTGLHNQWASYLIIAIGQYGHPIRMILFSYSFNVCYYFFFILYSNVDLYSTAVQTTLVVQYKFNKQQDQARNYTSSRHTVENSSEHFYFTGDE